jgi:hypothetical protein
VLDDGAWLLVTETMSGGTDPRLRRAWLGGPGAWKAVSYRAADGFDPADATALPEAALWCSNGGSPCSAASAGGWSG